MADTQTDLPTLDPYWCNILLACWGGGGRLAPSGFEERLFELIAHADNGNRERIARGYPAAVTAAQVWNHERGGSDRVRETAKRY